MAVLSIPSVSHVKLYDKSKGLIEQIKPVSKVTRELYVIESPPVFVEEAREKIIVPMTAEEAAITKKENPYLIVRLAEEDEKLITDIEGDL